MSTPSKNQLTGTGGLLSKLEPVEKKPVDPAVKVDSLPKKSLAQAVLEGKALDAPERRESYKDCPSCGERDYKILSRQGSFLSVRCNKCQHLWGFEPNQCPTREELKAQAYANQIASVPQNYPWPVTP